jgi:spore germination protein YaaH
MRKLVQVMCRASQGRVSGARGAAALLALLAPLALLGLSALGAARSFASHVVRTEVWAFTGPWDPASDASLGRHAGDLDVAITGWIALDSATAAPVLPSPYRDAFRPVGAAPARFAIVTSWQGLSFHPSSVRTLGSNPVRLAQAAQRIADASRRSGYTGLVLDFEEQTPGDLTRLVAVIRAITDSAHSHGLSRVAVAVPAADTASYPTRALLAATDLVIPMLYDQHWDTSPPGAISDPSWVRASLAVRLTGVDRNRIVAGLPTYAYRWPRGRSGEQISYDEARRGAARGGTRLARDRATETLHATERNGDQLWATDAVLLRTLVDVARSLGVERVSLWRLGQEDPAIWRAGVLR